MKKILSVVMILLMVLSMFPTIVMQVEASDVDLTVCESTNTQLRGDDPSAAIGIGWTDEDSDPPNAPVLAYNVEYAKGRAFFTGDVNWKDDRYRSYGDNEKLVVNSFDWLSISGKSVLWVERNVWLSYGIDLAYFDGLKAFLIANGYTVTKYTGTITSTALSGYDILHIGIGGNWIVAFSTSEIDAIVDFVSAGHGFMLEGENADCHTEYIDPIGLRFGVTFDKNHVRDPTNNAGREIDPIIHIFVTHPVTSGISTYIPIASCSLTGPAEPPPPVVAKMPVPYFYQGDTNWCVSTSAAMIMRYYGIIIHPWDVAEGLLQGHNTPTTIFHLMPYLSGAGFGYDLISWVTKDKLVSTLREGEPIVLSIPGWKLGGVGHAVVLTGYSNEDDTGTFFINDPSGALIDYIFGYGVFDMPYVQVSVPWDELEPYATATGAVALGIRGDPSAPSGTMSLVGGGSYDDLLFRTVSVEHGSNSWSDVYIWESGFVWNPLSGDTMGLTWRTSPTHQKGLDSEDTFEILGNFFNRLIVNPTNASQEYLFEVTFTKSGWQKWTSGEISLTVPAYSMADPPISTITVKDILDEYGVYTIRFWLFDSDGSLCDRIELPSIEYSPTLTLSLESPANLLVTDPEGSRIGFDPSTGEAINEIPEATYSGPGFEPQVVSIPNPVEGNYVVLLIGIDDGTYCLTTELILPKEIISQIHTGEIVEGAVYVYEISISDEVMTTSPDPVTELEHLKEFIDGLSDDSFDQSIRRASHLKNALFNKIDEVVLKVEAGNYTDAINKLFHDIRTKMDGDSTAKDWIVDAETQSNLCVIIDHIISSIETLQQE